MENTYYYTVTNSSASGTNLWGSLGNGTTWQPMTNQGWYPDPQAVQTVPYVPIIGIFDTPRPKSIKPWGDCL